MIAPKATTTDKHYAECHQIVFKREVSAGKQNEGKNRIDHQQKQHIGLFEWSRRDERRDKAQSKQSKDGINPAIVQRRDIYLLPNWLK